MATWPPNAAMVLAKDAGKKPASWAEAIASAAQGRSLVRQGRGRRAGPQSFTLKTSVWIDALPGGDRRPGATRPWRSSGPWREGQRGIPCPANPTARCIRARPRAVFGDASPISWLSPAMPSPRSTNQRRRHQVGRWHARPTCAYCEASRRYRHIRKGSIRVTI